MSVKTDYSEKLLNCAFTGSPVRAENPPDQAAPFNPPGAVLPDPNFQVRNHVTEKPVIRPTEKA
jgi:hypothetical protein